MHIFDQYRKVIAEDRTEQLIASAPYLKSFVRKQAQQRLDIPRSVLIQELTHLSYLKAHLELGGLGKKMDEAHQPLPDLASIFLERLKKARSEKSAWVKLDLV